MHSPNTGGCPAGNPVSNKEIDKQTEERRLEEYLPPPLEVEDVKYTILVAA